MDIWDIPIALQVLLLAVKTKLGCINKTEYLSEQFFVFIGKTIFRNFNFVEYYSSCKPILLKRYTSMYFQQIRFIYAAHEPGVPEASSKMIDECTDLSFSNRIASYGIVDLIR